MYKLTATCSPSDAEQVIAPLRANDEVSNVLRLSSIDGKTTTEIITALVQRRAIDVVLQDLRSVRRWEAGELVFIEVDFAVREDLAQLTKGTSEEKSEDILGWEIIQNLARAESRQSWWYLLFMACAGMIAAIGLVTDLPVLIVGAMSLSPDLAPSNAIAIGLATRNYGNVRRSLQTLIVGLSVAMVAALVVTVVLDLIGYLPDPLTINEELHTFVTVVDAATVIVALTAGVAAMTAFVTKQANTAVGVAISVTTVPAAAYAGVAIADRATADGLAAVGVLAVNIICLTLAQNLTLLFVRRWRIGRQQTEQQNS